MSAPVNRFIWLMSLALLIGAVLFVLKSNWAYLPMNTGPGTHAATAERGGNDNQVLASNDQSSSNAQQSENASPQDRAVVRKLISQVRDQMRKFERENASILLETEAKRFIHLRPPTERQLDALYDSLTKTAEELDSQPAVSRLFRDEAANILREFETYKGRSILFTVPTFDPFSSPTLPMAVFKGPEAEVKVADTGAIEINAEETRLESLPDWDNPESSSRRRYEHVVDPQKTHE